MKKNKKVTSKTGLINAIYEKINKRTKPFIDVSFRDKFKNLIDKLSMVKGIYDNSSDFVEMCQGICDKISLFFLN